MPWRQDYIGLVLQFILLESDQFQQNWVHCRSFLKFLSFIWKISLASDPGVSRKKEEFPPEPHFLFLVENCAQIEH
jgi:hypothetical protein